MSSWLREFHPPIGTEMLCFNAMVEDARLGEFDLDVVLDRALLVVHLVIEFVLRNPWHGGG